MAVQIIIPGRARLAGGTSRWAARWLSSGQRHRATMTPIRIWPPFPPGRPRRTQPSGTSGRRDWSPTGSMRTKLRRWPRFPLPAQPGTRRLGQSRQPTPGQQPAASAALVGVTAPQPGSPTGASQAAAGQSAKVAQGANPAGHGSQSAPAPGRSGAGIPVAGNAGLSTRAACGQWATPGLAGRGTAAPRHRATATSATCSGHDHASDGRAGRRDGG